MKWLLLLFGVLVLVNLVNAQVYTAEAVSFVVLQNDSDSNGDGLSDVVTEEFLYSYNATTNITTLEIFVNDTIQKGNFKWRAALCDLSGGSTLEKSEYNPVTQVWTNTGPLIKDTLVFYGMPSYWCNETGGEGFPLFGAGSGDRRYRLHVDGEYFNFNIYSGESSEIINTGKIEYSYELVDEIEGRKYTSQCFKCDLPVNVTLNAISGEEDLLVLSSFYNGRFENATDEVSFEYVEFLTILITS